MKFENVFIPYGGYWSTPFVKWQGKFANLHPIRFAGEVAARALKERNIDAQNFDALFLGMTVPQKGAFYAAPWLAAMLGAPEITGPTFSQACATSARVLASAATEIETGTHDAILGVTLDRTSNGPHIYYPNPLGPGGKGDTEDWVWDNFNCDPHAGIAMIQTAENVARENDISKEQQDEMALLRYAQYQDALKDDAAFHRKYMMTPIDVGNARKSVLIQDDEGIFPTTREGLEKLKPVLDGGTVTYGGQTFPADGNAGMIVTTRERARELSRAENISIQLVAVGTARAKKGFMGQAPVPAAQRALSRAGISLDDVRAIKSHNPFAVNDIYFCEQLKVKPEAMNNYGSSLIFGHPQGPTGMRLIIELIEELALRGGGYGLFTGCAAGDTAMAWVVRVGD
ncbi:MAG: acetyl-CoA acetyltransferase [Chloroflexi bacterium UTCFX4]|jgi:acetyl-CoA acetyltransferase family protein|nr:MAG: acetyl-CoA acetyltransferase [Chloroflexi bacterium UTCFX4]